MSYDFYLRLSAKVNKTFLFLNVKNLDLVLLGRILLFSRICELLYELMIYIICINIGNQQKIYICFRLRFALVNQINAFLAQTLVFYGGNFVASNAY